MILNKLLATNYGAILKGFNNWKGIPQPKNKVGSIFEKSLLLLLKRRLR